MIASTAKSKFLLVAAGIPTIIASLVGLITIWGWLTAPATKLVAEVQYSDFVWPPGFEKPPLPAFGRIDGIWFIRLKNSGSLTTTAVTLTLPPETVFARVTKPGGKSEDLAGNVMRNQELFTIGDLQPQQRALVVVWTASPPSPTSADAISLSHSAGVGDVVIRQPIGPFWLWMERNWGAVVFAVFSFSLVFWLPTLVAKLVARKYAI